jgi:hypothetical protein
MTTADDGWMPASRFWLGELLHLLGEVYGKDGLPYDCVIAAKTGKPGDGLAAAAQEGESSMTLTSHFERGQRVQTHPATGTWMKGDRYGTVVKRSSKYVTVHMDRSGRVLRFLPDNLMAA